LAAVCHGPQLLLSAAPVRGRTLTAWQTVQGDLRQAGELEQRGQWQHAEGPGAPVT
jgi:putative intracellular protease/amidase